MDFHSQVQGYVLAGGSSRRMGRDKRWIVVGGQTLLDRAIDVTCAVTGRAPLLLGGDFDAGVYAGRRVLPDAEPHKGPLGGLVSALRHCTAPWALVLPLDLPRLTTAIIKRLIDACDEESDVIAFSTGDRTNPLPALFRTRVAPYWEERLAEGRLSLREGYAYLKVKAVFLPRSGDILLNLNEPSDLRKLA